MTSAQLGMRWFHTLKEPGTRSEKCFTAKSIRHRGTIATEGRRHIDIFTPLILNREMTKLVAGRSSDTHGPCLPTAGFTSRLARWCVDVGIHQASTRASSTGN